MRVFIRAISYFRDDLPRILLQLGLIVLQTLFGLLSPFPLAILLLRALKEVLGMVQNLLRIKVGYFGLMRVRCDLFRKLQELSASYHRSQPQGDAIYRVSYDTFGFQTMLSIAMGVLLNVLTLVMMSWIMLSMNW